MNSLYLIGRLTRDPEVYKKDNVKNAHFTLAVRRQFKNTDGLYETDFITCTVWNAIADRIKSYCKKGDLIAIKGRIQNNNYIDKNDNKVYTYEIIADQISFVQSASQSHMADPELEEDEVENLEDDEEFAKKDEVE